MFRLAYVRVVVVLGMLWGALPCCGQASRQELVVNPRFETRAGASLPEGWLAWRPDWEKAACRLQRVAGGLEVKSQSDPYAVGGVVQHVKGIRADQAYRIAAVCELEDIASPYRSVIVRISWLNNGRLVHPAGMLVRGPILEGRTARFSDVLTAPPDANEAKLSLEVKWPGRGSVLWKHVSLTAAPKPGPRYVKIGTVFMRPKRSTPQKNLELWCEQIDAAGKLDLDIVCLGEVITRVGTEASLQDAAQPIPGPVTQRLARAAKDNDIWVVAGLTERFGDVVYNTAVLFDRKGRIAGTYRKTHLPREEWKKGVRPGHQYPVFDTEFGRVAMQICYDWFFPEPTAILALHGAEIVFAPTWGNTLPDEDGMVNGETVFRVRARDNGVYMVPSVYSGSSLVIDPMGRILASNEGKEGVFWAKVDLNRRECLRWVGHWRSIGPRDRMPETYQPLAAECPNGDGNEVAPRR